MAVPAEIGEAIWQLSDPTDVMEISRIAVEAARNTSASDGIWDLVELAAKEASAAQNDTRLAALWRLTDRMCKEHEALKDAFASRLAVFADTFAPAPDSPHYARFAQILEGFKPIFGTALMTIVSVKLHAKHKQQLQQQNAPTLGFPSEPASAASSSSRQLTVSARTLAGYTAQSGNNARPEGAKHALVVKTRDSLQAVRTAAMYAPLRPVEMPTVELRPDADAPSDRMQALPAGFNEAYLDQRRAGLKRLFDGRRNGQSARGQPGASDDGSPRTVVDPFADVVMPVEFPRDEHGVKIGNFPAGVRFLREAIRSCGGALELSLLEERIAQISDREAQSEYGNLRQFIQIHRPTFYVTEELGKWIVRLTGDPEPAHGSDEYSWQRMECPKCTKHVAGKNLARHTDSRRCIDFQTAKGMSGITDSPIAALAFAARTVLENIDAGTLDDDDVMYFAECVRTAAAKVPRYREGSAKSFSPILKALRVVRDYWLASKGLAEMSEAPVTPEDGPYAALFAAFASNMRRLPIPWIETGDIIDMGRRFCSQLYQPYPPTPRPGDPRIKVANMYPGFMFADSGTDEDDAGASSQEEEFSDDEAEQFEFAPPVTIMETIMAAGVERETKKINFRLRTAPPIPAALAVRQDGTKTVAEVYASKNQHQQQQQLHGKR